MQRSKMTTNRDEDDDDFRLFFEEDVGGKNSSQMTVTPTTVDVIQNTASSDQVVSSSSSNVVDALKLTMVVTQETGGKGKLKKGKEKGGSKCTEKMEKNKRMLCLAGELIEKVGSKCTEKTGKNKRMLCLAEKLVEKVLFERVTLVPIEPSDTKHKPLDHLVMVNLYTRDSILNALSVMNKYHSESVKLLFMNFNQHTKLFSQVPGIKLNYTMLMRHYKLPSTVSAVEWNEQFRTDLINRILYIREFLAQVKYMIIFALAVTDDYFDDDSFWDLLGTPEYYVDSSDYSPSVIRYTIPELYASWKKWFGFRAQLQPLVIHSYYSSGAAKKDIHEGVGGLIVWLFMKEQFKNLLVKPRWFRQFGESKYAGMAQLSLDPNITAKNTRWVCDVWDADTFISFELSGSTNEQTTWNNVCELNVAFASFLGHRKKFTKCQPYKLIEIPDWEVPSREAVENIIESSKAGKRIVMHCGAGQGRTGVVMMVLAMQLKMIRVRKDPAKTLQNLIYTVAKDYRVRAGLELVKIFADSDFEHSSEFFKMIPAESIDLKLLKQMLDFSKKRQDNGQKPLLNEVDELKLRCRIQILSYKLIGKLLFD